MVTIPQCTRQAYIYIYEKHTCHFDCLAIASFCTNNGHSNTWPFHYWRITFTENGLCHDFLCITAHMRNKSWKTKHYSLPPPTFSKRTLTSQILGLWFANSTRANFHYPNYRGFEGKRDGRKAHASNSAPTTGTNAHAQYQMYWNVATTRHVKLLTFVKVSPSSKSDPD